MNDADVFAKEILGALITKFERNEKCTFKLSDKNCKQYFKKNKLGFEFKEELNKTLLLYRKKCFIQIDFNVSKTNLNYFSFKNSLDNGNDVELKKYDISKIHLNTENIDNVYTFLKRRRRCDISESYINVYTKYLIENEVCEYAKYAINILDTKKDNSKEYKFVTKFNLQETEQLLNCLSYLLYNNEEISLYYFSVRLFGNSKVFDKKFRSTIISILKEHYGASDIADDKDILSEYNVLQNIQNVNFKGDLQIYINDTLFDVSKLDFNIFALDSRNIQSIKMLKGDFKRIVTIENKYVFDYVTIPDSLLIFTGGFSNSKRIELIKKVYSFFPNSKFYHFGDIDAGGFYILHNLKEKTGIDYIPLCMDIHTIKKYENSAISLSVEDISRLNNVKAKYPEHSEVIKFMLEKKIKLEQENIENSYIVSTLEEYL